MNLRDAASKNLIFVGGKGGVGKTVVSLAIAHAISEQKKKTLWVGFEDPTQKLFHMNKVSEHLTVFNNSAPEAFEEYVGMKLGIPKIAQLFLQNSLLKSLIKASPGVHELVLLGKIWFERNHYDHVVVDLPSTGYGLTMFQATGNFGEMLKGSPVSKDAIEMLKTFGNPNLSSQIIVALAEEMPLRESVELKAHLSKLFPEITPAFIANRIFPKPSQALDQLPKTNATEFIFNRIELESMNLKIWQEANIPYEILPFIPAGIELKNSVVQALKLEVLKCL